VLCCELRLIPSRESEPAVAFDVRNDGEHKVQIEYVEPFIAFEFRASVAGSEVEVVQPSLELVSRHVKRELGPGEVLTLATPIRLRFDSNAPPSGGPDPRVWILQSGPSPVLLEASLRFGKGEPTSCSLETGPF
jgi:hypothetical protein